MLVASRVWSKRTVFGNTAICSKLAPKSRPPDLTHHQNPWRSSGWLLGLKLFGFLYELYSKEAKSLTFWRGARSQPRILRLGLRHDDDHAVPSARRPLRIRCLPVSAVLVWGAGERGVSGLLIAV